MTSTIEKLTETANATQESFALIHQELERIKNLCVEGNDWAKADIRRAIAQLQAAILFD